MSPNNQPWLRKYDAIIAERAEGHRVEWRECSSGAMEPVLPDNFYAPVDRYNLHTQHIARAQESWRAQDADYRSYVVESFAGEFFARCNSLERECSANAITESAARAWSLLRALKEN